MDCKYKTDCPDEMGDFTYTLTIHNRECKFRAEDNVCWHPKYRKSLKMELKEEHDCCKLSCPYLKKKRLPKLSFMAKIMRKVRFR